MLSKTQVAVLSVASNMTLTFGKVITGVLTGAVSIISEGIHSGIDLIAALIALVAVKESSKPADERHTYGHGKIENVSGTVEALLIFLAAIWIIYEAVQKARTGVYGNNYGLGMIIMSISALLNLGVSTLLKRVGKRTDSIALQADALHLRTDVFTSLGVLIGLILIKITGWVVIDTITAILVAVLIMKAAFDLTKEAFMPLVDVSLPQKERELIYSVLTKHKKDYVGFHELRTRRAGAERHIDLHLVVPKYMHFMKVHELCDQIEREIAALLPGADILIHAEPCSDREKPCSKQEESLCKEAGEKAPCLVSSKSGK